MYVSEQIKVMLITRYKAAALKYYTAVNKEAKETLISLNYGKVLEITDICIELGITSAQLTEIDREIEAALNQ